jgi:hypothetical protein
MNKVKVTFAIRVPKDTTSFAPAKMHLDTLHEIHKHDESLMVFNTARDTKINAEEPMSDMKYKEMFNPVEKRIGRGPGWIRISHVIFLSGKAADCKEAIFPYLKRNKIFMYINPKPGLKHFSAIGVLFGPHPEYTWRDELATLLVETIRSEITDDEANQLGHTGDNKPKIILSLNSQTIGSSTSEKISSVALEVRVPSGKERIYIDILKWLYEKAETEEIIISTTLGNFFPYYMKSKLPEVYNFLMQQQNANMARTTIIPIFGYTNEARNFPIKINGEDTTVKLALATTEDIIRIEATPSTWNLFKYLVIVKVEKKDKVMRDIKKNFGLIDKPLEKQPTNFPIPRSGGSKKTPAKLPINYETKEESKITAYMTSLETLARANNPQEAGPASPSRRHRKFTISYASAAKHGFLEEPTTANSSQTQQINALKITPDMNSQDSEINSLNMNASKEENTIDTGKLTGSSLTRSLTNSKIQTNSRDIDTELKEMKMQFKQRINKQEEQMKEIVQVMKSMNEDIEQRMAHAVLAVLV